MNNLIALMPNLKIIYILLIILFIINVNIFINKKNIDDNYKYVINGIILIVIALLTSYLNNTIEGIFNLSYLSVKSYIIVLILTNIITIITLQKNMKFIYKIINYLLFGIISIIFCTIFILIIGTNLNLITNNTTQYTTIYLNISIIIFIIYLSIINLIYIITNLLNTKELINKVFSKNNKIIKKITTLPKKEITIQKKETKPQKKETSLLTMEELLNYKNKTNFKINEIDCSIIFEDSIPENIFKNYQILNNNINDKLVNGYTLEENKLIKSICLKLDVTNPFQIDINNLSILNKISIEEYNFLKEIYK